MKNKENTFIPMQCPNCNGKLEKGSNSEEYFCPHCETTYYFTLAPKKTNKSPKKDSQTIYITNQTILPTSDEQNKKEELELQEKEKNNQIYIPLEKIFQISNFPILFSLILGFSLAFKILSFFLSIASFSFNLCFLILGLFLSFIWLLILKLFFQLFIQYNTTDDILGLLKYHLNKLKNLIHKH